jgi:hypothetical protein
MSNIRLATELDLVALTNIAKSFVEYFNHFKWDEDSVKETLQQLLKTGFIYVAEKDSVIIGVIGGVVVPNMWNKNETICQELFWWVEEEYRESSVSVRLLKQFESIAPVGSKIALSLLPKSNIKTSTLSKLGYEPAELAFTKV